MIRVLCQVVDTCPDGSKVGCRFKTFEIEAPEIEAFLREQVAYESRTAIGVELPECTSERTAGDE